MTSEHESTAGGEKAACEQCGALDVLEIGGLALCMDCITLAGCGCAGQNGGDAE